MTRFADIKGLADNPLTYPEGKDFAVILGANPSKGARSVILWNAAFKAHGIDTVMLPIDVSSQNLPRLLSVLEENRNCLGGAVAIPHKEAVARWLQDRVATKTADIGAVNCLFRRPDGKLVGTNTDGEAALRSFENQFGKPTGKSVLLIGLGGAGKAVAAFFKRAVEPSGQILLSSRSASGKEVAERLFATWKPWNEMPLVLPQIDVLINCTSVGHGEQVGRSPVSEAHLALLPSSAQIFDVVYQPSPSALLSQSAARGLAGLDGADMNLEQAVLAYGYAAPAPRGEPTTRSAMVDARFKLG